MSLDAFTTMFSQRTGVQQSMSGSIMNAILGYIMQNMMQKGLSSLLGGGSSGTNTDAGGLKSALSSLGTLNRDHSLVQYVQQNAGIQDPDQATQYTQHGVNLLNVQTDKDPKGRGSLLGSLMGGGIAGNNSSQQSAGIGDMLGI